MVREDISILLVDDDPDDIMLINDAIADIEDGRYRVVVCNGPEEALELLQDTIFDIILSDYRMGATTGIDLITDIRKSGVDTPFILLTGMSEREVDEQALAAGASDYLNKSDLSAPMIDRAIRYALASWRRQQLLASVLANVPAAICVVDEEKTPQIWNAEFRQLAKEDAAADEATEIAKFADAVLSTDEAEFAESYRYEKKATNLPDGTTILTLNDISEHIAALDERKRAQEEADHQARTCFLTGLPNRLAFTQKLEDMIASGERFKLLNIDLDKFKGYNDVYGHPFGDALLVELSKAMKNCCGPNDFLARVGGDEFIAIHSYAGDEEGVETLEQKVVRALRADFEIHGRKVNIGLSVGAAIFPDHGDSLDALMANADIAMYRAKEFDGSHIEFFNSQLDDSVRKRRGLINDLEMAIRDDLLDVNFQPQFDLKSGELIGCEALARWMHPVEGPIPPDVFIELAEESGLVEALGKQILRRAAAYAVGWAKPLKLAVNISGFQISHTNLVQDVQTILLETGFPAKRLELEVTESVLLEDFDHALHVLRGIKNLGVDLAMDDFGTGFSSLSSLISFPFDKLKIDRSFVMDMDKREKLKSVIRTCIGLGQNLDLSIVAEGVEQESHIDFLREAGCDQVQGYLMGKPMPPELLESFMAQYQRGEIAWEHVKAKISNVA